MDSFEQSELKAILTEKESFEEFRAKYFFSETGEKVSYGIAKEFYEDYISSRLSFEDYVNATTETIS